MRDERPLSHVSAPVLATLAAGLALQIALHAVAPQPEAKAQDLTQPPAASLLRRVGSNSVAITLGILASLTAKVHLCCQKADRNR